MKFILIINLTKRLHEIKFTLHIMAQKLSLNTYKRINKTNVFYWYEKLKYFPREFLHNVYICGKANKPRWSWTALLFTRFNGVLYWDWQLEANIDTDIFRQYRIFESVVLTEQLRTNILLHFLHRAMNEMKSTMYAFHYSSGVVKVILTFVTWHRKHFVIIHKKIYMIYVTFIRKRACY